MINRGRMALAAIGISCLFPLAVHAGAGGNPTAPGAGKSTDYCCQTWETVESRRQGDGKGFTFLHGTGCQVIADDAFSKNTCPGTTVKCRGEFFTPGPGNADGPTGKVDRCLTP